MTEQRFTGFDLWSCNNMRQCFGELYENGVFVIDKTGVKTLEILNASFVASETSIFGKIDDTYLAKELKWYNTMEQNINAMDQPVPKLWKSSSGDNGETNSNYGWSVFSADNHNQFINVREELVSNPYSRRAIIIYTRPSMHSEYNKNGMNDFICTNTVQYFIRKNHLETVVNMRSNDAVFGYKCDRYWQMIVRDKLWQSLRSTSQFHDLSRGSIQWNAGSFHIYERHFYLVWAWLQTGRHDVSMKEQSELYNDYVRQTSNSRQMGSEILGGS